jgi:hypothetical protein
VEYLLSNNLGLSLSGGYLVAPKGTSRNFTLGAAMNYHLSTKHKNHREFNTAEDRVYSGFRFNVFPQTGFDVHVGENSHDNVNMLSIQFDYLVNDHWYFATQASVAYNDFLDYPGYGEILTGFGIQNKFSTTNSYQNFFQILIGANVHGILIKPSIGINYSLSENLALYGQLGKTMSVNKFNLYPDDKQFRSYTIGLGLTYRFSLL